MFSHLLLKTKLEKYYKSELREKHFLNLKNIYTILVLFSTSEYDESDTFIAELERMGKKVTGYGYQAKYDQYDYSETPYHIVTYKDSVSKLTSIAEELKKSSYDLVIDLTVRRNLSVEYLLAYANASLKTGLKKDILPPYDLSIASLNDVEGNKMKVRELGKQIIYYLYTIHTK